MIDEHSSSSDLGKTIFEPQIRGNPILLQQLWTESTVKETSGTVQ